MEPRRPPRWASPPPGRSRGGAPGVTTQIAGHFLGAGIRPEEVEEILLGFATRCRPAFDADEARTIVRDLAAKDARKRHGGVAAVAAPIEGATDAVPYVFTPAFDPDHFVSHFIAYGSGS